MVDPYGVEGAAQPVTTEEVGGGAGGRLGAVVVAVIALLVVWVLVAPGGEGGGDAAPTTSVPSTVTTAPEPPDPQPVPTPWVDEVPVTPLAVPVQVVLVRPTAEGFLVLDPSGGRIWHHALDRRPVAMAPAGPGLAFAHTEAGSLEVVSVEGGVRSILAFEVDWWAPSAEPTRSWVRFANSALIYRELDAEGIATDEVAAHRTPEIDPRLRYEPGGGTYDITGGQPRWLGPHRVLAVARDSVLARRCDERAQCRLEQRSLDDPGAPWRSVARDARTAVLSPDGRFAVLGVEGRSDRSLVELTGAAVPVATGLAADGDGSVVFGADGEHLFTLTDGALTVTRLVDLRTETIDLPDEAIVGTGPWIAVSLGSGALPGTPSQAAPDVAESSDQEEGGGPT